METQRPLRESPKERSIRKLRELYNKYSQYPRYCSDLKQRAKFILAGKIKRVEALAKNSDQGPAFQHQLSLLQSALASDSFSRFLDVLQKIRSERSDALVIDLCNHAESSIPSSTPDDDVEDILHTTGHDARRLLDKPETLQGSLEHRLQKLHDRDHFRTIAPPRIDRAGDAAAGYSNEVAFSRTDPSFHSVSPRNGYVVGVGAATIWTMLDFFNKPEDIKGIISFDIDPAVILFGLTVVELAKRGISREEMVAYLYGETIAANTPHGERVFSHSEQDYLRVAASVVHDQPGLSFKRRLSDCMLPTQGEFLRDRLTRGQRYRGKYQDGVAQHRRLNIANVLYKQWDKIVSLAKSGKISFVHASFNDPNVLNTIRDEVPDIATSKNIIYTSNAVDHRYLTDVQELDKTCNPRGKSVYITTRQKDGYVLRPSRKAPFISK